MEKNWIIWAVCILFTCETIGQTQKPKQQIHSSGKQHGASAGAVIPWGNFSLTHVMGVAANYSWSHHRFGRMDPRPVKPLGFTANAGAAYYFGKHEKVSGYSYQYPGYIFIHTAAGLIYNPSGRVNLMMTAGPALGINNGLNRFNFVAGLEGAYYFNKKMAINPGIIFMKESGAEPIFAASMKATIAF